MHCSRRSATASPASQAPIRWPASSCEQHSNNAEPSKQANMPAFPPASPPESHPPERGGRLALRPVSQRSQTSNTRNADRRLSSPVDATPGLPTIRARHDVQSARPAVPATAATHQGDVMTPTTTGDCRYRNLDPHRDDLRCFDDLHRPDQHLHRRAADPARARPIHHRGAIDRRCLSQADIAIEVVVSSN